MKDLSATLASLSLQDFFNSSPFFIPPSFEQGQPFVSLGGHNDELSIEVMAESEQSEGEGNSDVDGLDEVSKTWHLGSKLGLSADKEENIMAILEVNRERATKKNANKKKNRGGKKKKGSKAANPGVSQKSK